MRLADAGKAAAFVILCESIGVIGSVFTASSIPTWYATLVKPELAPPNWIFGPVWTTLYALMGIAAFLVWRNGWWNRNVKIALGVFVAQLLLNLLWSIIFFGLQAPLAAFIEIIILWCAIAATILAFARISKSAAWLLVPYLVWVSFAGYLNYMLWALN